MTLPPDATRTGRPRADARLRRGGGPAGTPMRAAGLEMTNKGPDLGQALTEADLAVSRLLHASSAPT